MREQEIGELIYEAARAQRADELQKIAEEHPLFRSYYKTPDNMLYNVVNRLAKEGNVEAVNFLIERFKAAPADALEGYAWGEHPDAMNSLSARFKYIDYLAAARGYSRIWRTKKHLQEEIDEPTTSDLLRFISLINCESTRSFIIYMTPQYQYPRVLPETETDEFLLRRAKKLNELIREQGLSFEEAEDYCSLFFQKDKSVPFNKDATKGAFTWERAASQIAIPRELHSYILSLVTERSEQSNDKVFAAVQNRRLKFFAEVEAINDKNDLGGACNTACILM